MFHLLSYFFLIDIRRPDTLYASGCGKWINRIRCFFAVGGDDSFTYMISSCCEEYCLWHADCCCKRIQNIVQGTRRYTQRSRLKGGSKKARTDRAGVGNGDGFHEKIASVPCLFRGLFRIAPAGGGRRGRADPQGRDAGSSALHRDRAFEASRHPGGRRHHQGRRQPNRPGPLRLLSAGERIGRLQPDGSDDVRRAGLRQLLLQPLPEPESLRLRQDLHPGENPGAQPGFLPFGSG